MCTRRSALIGWILGMGCLVGVAGTARAQVPAPPDDFLVVVKVAPWERDQRAVVAERIRARLPGDAASRAGLPRDLLIVLTDGDGRAILPDTARRAADRRPPRDDHELTFTFESPDLPWTPEEIAFLSESLRAFYPVAKQIYGPPAFDLSVNVRQDPSIPVAGLYDISSNEMTLKGASPGMLDVLCHEMLHAFRDEDLIGLSSFEEGMARAAEVEVFDRLPAYVHPFDETHGYDYDVYYEALNRPEIGAAGVFLRWLATFHVVTLAWIYFNAPSVGVANSMIGRILGAFTGNLGPGTQLVTAGVLLAIIVGLAWQFVPEWVGEDLTARYRALPPVSQGIALGFVIVVCYFTGSVADFIYFQF